MSVLAQHLILRLEQSFDGTHERSALTGKIACSLALERCLEQIARAYAYAEGYSLVLRPARRILIDGI